jgi:hypothetical protein
MEPKTYIGEKITFSTTVLGKLVIYMQNTETRPQPLSLYKNQFKLDQRGRRKLREYNRVCELVPSTHLWKYNIELPPCTINVC